MAAVARHRSGRDLLVIACVGVCVYGCRARNETVQSPPLTLQVGVALPRPGVRGAGIGAVMQTLSSETLLVADRVGRVQPRICEKWEWAEEGRVLRLTLRPNVRFHDDTELTPQVAAEILRLAFAQPDTPPSFASVTAVKPVPPNVVEIHLRQIEALLPSDLPEIPIVKGKERIGTGPFRVSHESPMTFTAFDAYYQGRPDIGRVEIKPYPTLRSAWTAMMRGDINMLHEVSREAAHFVEQESSVRSYPFLRPYYFFVGFNVRHPVLGRREVRQALSQAVDRAAIVRDAMDGRGEPADGPIWKYFWAYSEAERRLAYNPEAARLRLDSAGFPVVASRPGAMPSRLRFTCLMYGEDPRFERIALVLQKQLYDIGVDMQLEAVPLTNLAKRVQSGDYDAFLLEMLSGRSLTWLYRAWRSRPPGVPVEFFASGYTAADAVLDRLRHTITEPETREAIGELQRVLYDDPPALFLAWPQASRAVSADIDVPYVPDSDIFGRVAKFRRATPGIARQ